MKEKLNKRWGLKLLSLLCAFFVWLGVVNVADPVITNTVEVPVEILNEDVLTQNNMTYEIVGKKTATITYEVKTTKAYRIRPADFRAYADLTDLYAVTGAIPIKIEVLSHSEFLESTPVGKTSTIKISTEPLQRKRFELGTQFKGTLEDGYEIGDMTIRPGYLYLEGPESLVGQVSSAGIEIKDENINTDVTGTAIPLYYDANGNNIPLDARIKSDCEAVQYTITVLKVKNLGLDFHVSGNVAPGYRYVGIQCDTQTIPVVGMKSSLASLHTLSIPGDVLNLDGAKADVVKTVDVSNYLPENVTIAGMNDSQIEVTLMVEKLAERDYSVKAADIPLQGQREGYRYAPAQNTVTVRVRGLKEELDQLKIDPASVEVKVSNLDVGRQTVKPAVQLGESFELVSVTDYVLDVQVMEEETSGGNTPEEPADGEAGGAANGATAPATTAPGASASVSASPSTNTSASGTENTSAVSPTEAAKETVKAETSKRAAVKADAGKAEGNPAGSLGS